MRIATRIVEMLKSDWSMDLVWMGTLTVVMLALFLCGNLNAHRTPQLRSIPVVKRLGPGGAPARLLPLARA